MEMKHSLHLSQTQKLIMTPRLQQALKLLQVPTLELQQILKQEIMQNPLLEEVDEVTDQEDLDREDSPDEAANKWHTFEIHCVGPRIKVIADGVTVIDADERKLTAPEEKGYTDQKTKPLKGASTGRVSPSAVSRAKGAGASSTRVSSSCRTPKLSTAAANSTGVVSWAR